MSTQPGETTRTVAVEDLDPLSLFGRNDANLRLVERSYPVQLTYRDGKIAVRGEPSCSTGGAARFLTFEMRPGHGSWGGRGEAG